MIRKPSGFIPVAMSLAAIGVIGVYLAMFGTARQEDEGTAAHLWQLLIGGQLPIVAFFAIKWLPAAPARAAAVLALQLAAGLIAVFPVWWFQW